MEFPWPPPLRFPVVCRATAEVRIAATPDSSHRPTCQTRCGRLPYIERDEEPERVVGESELLEADRGPKLQHFVDGNVEGKLDVVLGGLIEHRRQDQPNAPKSVAKR
jgi:hypothetical protein